MSLRNIVFVERILILFSILSFGKTHVLCFKDKQQNNTILEIMQVRENLHLKNLKLCKKISDQIMANYLQ